MISTGLSAYCGRGIYTLSAYPFPGNIRELISVTERFATLFDETRLNDRDYVLKLLSYCLDNEDEGLPPESIVCRTPAESEAKLDKTQEPLFEKPLITGDYKADLAEAENKILQIYYQQFNGNMTQLAQKLGISRTTLYNKINKKQR